MTGFAKIKSTCGLHVITYSATLDVPRELAWYLAGLLNEERYWRRTRRGRRALRGVTGRRCWCCGGFWMPPGSIGSPETTGFAVHGVSRPA